MNLNVGTHHWVCI